MCRTIPKTLVTRQAASHQRSQLTGLLIDHDLSAEVSAVISRTVLWLGALAGSELLTDAAETIARESLETEQESGTPSDIVAVSCSKKE